VVWAKASSSFRCRARHDSDSVNCEPQYFFNAFPNRRHSPARVALAIPAFLLNSSWMLLSNRFVSARHRVSRLAVPSCVLVSFALPLILLWLPTAWPYGLGPFPPIVFLHPSSHNCKLPYHEGFVLLIKIVFSFFSLSSPASCTGCSFRSCEAPASASRSFGVPWILRAKNGSLVKNTFALPPFRCRFLFAYDRRLFSPGEHPPVLYHDLALQLFRILITALTLHSGRRRYMFLLPAPYRKCLGFPFCVPGRSLTPSASSLLHFFGDVIAERSARQKKFLSRRCLGIVPVSASSERRGPKVSLSSLPSLSSAGYSFHYSVLRTCFCIFPVEALLSLICCRYAGGFFLVVT